MAPIYELARILDAFRRELPEPNLTFNVGLIAGGATAELDRRPDPARAPPARPTSSPPSPSPAATCAPCRPSRTTGCMAKMRAIVARHLPGASAEIAFDEDGYPPMAPTAGNPGAARPAERGQPRPRPAEMGALDPLKRGAGDISFVAADVDGLVGLGAGKRRRPHRPARRSTFPRSPARPSAPRS